MVPCQLDLHIMVNMVFTLCRCDTCKSMNQKGQLDPTGLSWAWRAKKGGIVAGDLVCGAIIFPSLHSSLLVVLDLSQVHGVHYVLDSWFLQCSDTPSTSRAAASQEVSALSGVRHALPRLYGPPQYIRYARQGFLRCHSACKAVTMLWLQRRRAKAW